MPGAAGRLLVLINLNPYAVDAIGASLVLPLTLAVDEAAPLYGDFPLPMFPVRDADVEYVRVLKWPFPAGSPWKHQ